VCVYEQLTKSSLLTQNKNTKVPNFYGSARHSVSFDALISTLALSAGELWPKLC